MKKEVTFLILFVLFSVSVFAQEDANITFNGTIPDLDLDTGNNNNVVDLSDYFFYNENISVEYKYKAGADGIEGLVIEINSDGDVDIEASSPGSRSVIFILDDDLNAVESNEVELDISGTALVSFSPNSDALNLTEGETKVFAASTTEGVEWTLDEVVLNTTQSTYSFVGDDVKVYTLKAKVGNVEKTWVISVLAEQIVDPPIVEEPVEEPEAVCGNNLREAGEDCSSCPSDVQCSQNAECQNGLCVPKSSGSLTKVIVYFVLGAAVIVLIVVGIILMRKKGMGKSLFDKFKKKSGEDKELEKTPLKEEKSQASKIQEKPHETENLEPLIEYFKKNLFNFERNVLKQEALKQGWTQEQIEKALAQMNTQNGQNQTNQKPLGRK